MSRIENESGFLSSDAASDRSEDDKAIVSKRNGTLAKEDHLKSMRDAYSSIIQHVGEYLDVCVMALESSGDANSRNKLEGD